MKGIIMICTCMNCRYTFSSATLPSACPDCGKKMVTRKGSRVPAVRPATGEEVRWYRNMQEELARSEVKKAV